MNGSSDQSDETPPAPSDSTRGREIRRFDAPHAQPRMRSLRAIRDEHRDTVEPAAAVENAAAQDDGSDGPLEADLLACDRVADRLMSTQAAQLAEYLRNRQSELVRQQRQLEEQQQALSKARQVQDAETSRPQPTSAAAQPSAASASVEPAGVTDETIRLLLETLEQQRLAHQQTLQAVLRRDERKDAPSHSPVAAAGSPAAPPPRSSDANRPTPEKSAAGVARPKMFAAGRSRSTPSTPSTPPSPSAASTPEAMPTAEAAQDSSVESARQAAAARQLLAEARRIHLETLEQRLVVEQLRLQLSAEAPHVDLQAAFRRLQAQFQRQHRQAWEELAVQEDETRELLAELDQRQTQLRRQRRALQNWVAQRYEDFEQLIGRLSAREQELDRQQREIDQSRQRDTEQAAEYQRQIRQLTAQLRCRDELGRVA